ncbi:GNAT family N-acetyltransferase [Nakamurella endophytica]|uniref:N-acetyltransferase domain-containing protein n=1 Tax=Nakamurella endophytica TaxID=1748367 RepID=A0A917SKF6_9ACTN|nr:GNAT family N-acetyltransferase [Nakamurella endophytica]GGL84859.1 hypothetical protein GCM10011594_00540 [Nakamurella endophytica]
MTGPVDGAAPLDASAAAARTSPGGDPELRRVGPHGRLAADHAFAVALVTLWLRVSRAGGPVGFVATVERPEVARAAAPVVEQLRQGAAESLVLLQNRTLVGFGLLVPGSGVTAHTAVLRMLMIDPDHQHRGLGRRLLDGLLDLATERGIERVTLSARGGEGLEGFYEAAGFTEWGRAPGAVRVAPGDDRDEIWFDRSVRRD